MFVLRVQRQEDVTRRRSPNHRASMLKTIVRDVSIHRLQQQHEQTSLLLKYLLQIVTALAHEMTGANLADLEICEQNTTTDGVVVTGAATVTKGNLHIPFLYLQIGCSPWSLCH